MTAGLLLALAFAAQAQDAALPSAWKHWSHSAPVAVPAIAQSRLVSVRIPADVLRATRSGHEDLRLVNDSGSEVPFVLRARTGRRSREARPAVLREVSFTTAGATWAVIELGEDPAIHNGIEIETPRQDLFARVTVEVSANRRSWRILEQGIPIYRFPSHDVRGNLTVRYAGTWSPHVRLRIAPDSGTLPVTGVRVWYEIKEDPELVPATPALAPDPAAPQGESWWTANAGSAGAPLSQVRFAVPGGTLFHRPVRLRVSDDGTTWRTIGTGEIYRMERPGGVRERLEVDFPETEARLVRVEMVNRNDPPLAGASPELRATPRRVVFRAEPGWEYRVIWGNSRAAPAQYELARLATEAELDAALPAELGPMVSNPAYADPAPWTERNPLVLWSALVVALVVLGVLALRSLRSSAPD